MKRIIVPALAVVPVAGLAQVDMSRAIGGFMHALKSRQNVQPAPKQQNPLEPQGHPGLPPREGTLPAPARPGEEANDLEILPGEGTFRQAGKKVYGKGGIHVLYRGYDIYGDELEGDTETEIFELRGNVKVIGADQVVTGGKVVVNFKDRTYRAEDADVQLRPSFLDNQVLDDVYVRGAHSHGSRRELWGEEGSLTTCNYMEPHFEFESENINVRPGRRMIMRDVRLKLLGRTLFSLPYLSIPLERRAARYLPEVGESPDEGYFIKFKYPIALRGNENFLDANIDYMTKLGTGLGADYDYRFNAGEGNLRVYGIVGTNNRTFEAIAHHLQRLGSTELNLDASFQRQNYITAPESTLTDIRANWRIPQRAGTTALNFFRNSNESPDFGNVQQVISLNDQRELFRRTNTNLDVSLASNSSSFSGGTQVQREQVDVRFSGQHDLIRAMAELEYQRSIPIGDTTNFFQAQDRTPVVYLRSDARRLFGNRFSSELPFQAELSVGEFANPGISDNVTRSHFDLNFQRPDRNTSRFGVSFDGRFRQGIYSDDTAQYVTGLGTAVRYTFTRDTGLNLRYNYLQPHGFSPLQFDRTGRTNFTSMDLSFNPIRNLQIGAQTGYDFLLEEQGETAWQSVGLRTEWRPASWFNLRALSTYDTFSQAWSNIRFDLGYRPGSTFISAGARYDGLRHTWGALNLYVDGLKWGRLKASTVLAYNGYLKEFEARHFSFTYDLHCAEAILQIIDNPIGFRPGTQVSFFIRVKAFPFNTPFGTGRRGQSFGTGTGRDGF